MPTPSSHPLDLQSLPIGALTPDPRNARQHPDRHVRQLAKSIQAFGFNCPVLIDAQNHVVAGHGRLLAAKSLGWTEVPAIRLEHLTPDQVRAYRIADNRLTDCSTWDDRLLAEQLKASGEEVGGVFHASIGTWNVLLVKPAAQIDTVGDALGGFACYGVRGAARMPPAGAVGRWLDRFRSGKIPRSRSASIPGFPQK